MVAVPRIPGWWTVQELAERTGLSDQTIRWHCRQGTIDAHDTGRVWLIEDAAADAFCQDLAIRKVK